MAITKLISNTLIDGVATQLYRNMICVVVENNNSSLILLELYINNICTYKHEVTSGEYEIDAYLEDGDNTIKIVATEVDNPQNTKTITGNMKVNLYGYQDNVEPILSNFIGTDDDKLRIDINNAKLKYAVPKAGTNVRIGIDTTVASHFFQVIGENAEYYQISTDNIPIIQGDIIKRPLHVVFDGVRKEYDGTSDISDAYIPFEHDKNYYFIDPQNNQIDYRRSAIVNETNEIKQNYKLIYNMNDLIEEYYEFVDSKDIDFSSFKIYVDNMIGYCDSVGNINFLYNTQFVTQQEAEQYAREKEPKGLYYFIADTNRSHLPTCNDIWIESDKIYGTGIPGATIKITFSYNGLTRYVIVDESGYWELYIPAGVKLKVDQFVYISQIEVGYIESVTLKKQILESLKEIQSKAPLVYPIRTHHNKVEGRGIPNSRITIVFPDKNLVRETGVTADSKWIYNITEEDGNPLVCERTITQEQGDIETNQCIFSITSDIPRELQVTYNRLNTTGFYIIGEIINTTNIKLTIAYNNILNMKSLYMELPINTDVIKLDNIVNDITFSKNFNNGMSCIYNSELQSLVFNGTAPENSPGFTYTDTNQENLYIVCELILNLKDNYIDILDTDTLTFELNNINVLENRIGNNDKVVTVYQTEFDKSISVPVKVGIGKQDQMLNPVIYNISEYSDIIDGEGISGSLIQLQIYNTETNELVFEKLTNEQNPIIVDDTGYWSYQIQIDDNFQLQRGWSIIAIQYSADGDRLPSYETTTHVNVGMVTPCPTINPLLDGDRSITGSGIAGATIYLQNILFEDETELFINTELETNQIIVNNSGTWSYTLDLEQIKKFVHGRKIAARQKITNKGISGDYLAEVKVKSYGMSIAPVINPISEGDKIISGTCTWDTETTSSDTPEAYLYLWYNNTYVKKFKAKSSGIWSFKIPSNLDLFENDVIGITDVQSLDGESMFVSTTVSRTNKKSSDTPTINTVNVLNTTITGTGIKNSTIELFINNKSITSTIKVSSSGTWSYTIPATKIKLNANDEIRVIQREPDKVRSKNVVTYVQDMYYSDAPLVYPIKENDTIISGTGIKDSIITMYLDEQELSYITTKVKSDGTWTISVEDNNINLSFQNRYIFTQAEPNKQVSSAVIIPVQQLNTIPVFSVNDWTNNDSTITGTGFYISDSIRGKISVYAEETLLIGKSNGDITLEQDDSGNITETPVNPAVGTNDYIYVQSNGTFSITLSKELKQAMEGNTIRFVQEVNDDYYPLTITITNTLETLNSSSGMSERLIYIDDTFDDNLYTDTMWTLDWFRNYKNKLFFGMPDYEGTRSYGDETETTNSKSCTYRVQLYDSSQTQLIGGMPHGNGAVKTVYADVKHGEEIVVSLPYRYRAANSKEMYDFQTTYNVTVDDEGNWVFPLGKLSDFKKQISPKYKLVSTQYDFYDLQVQEEWPYNEIPLYCLVSKPDERPGKKNAWLYQPEEIINISIIDSKHRLIAQTSTDTGFLKIPSSTTPEYDAWEDDYKYVRANGEIVKATTQQTFSGDVNFTGTFRLGFWDEDSAVMYGHNREYISFGISDDNKNYDEFRIWLQNDISIQHVSHTPEMQESSTSTSKKKNEIVEQVDDSLGYVEILQNKDYNFILSFKKDKLTIKVGSSRTFTIGSENLVTNLNRKHLYIASKYTDSVELDNLQVYYDRPVAFQYNWQLRLEDNFNENTFRHWTTVPNPKGKTPDEVFNTRGFELVKGDKFNRSRYMKAFVDYHEEKYRYDNMLRICEDHYDKKYLELNYFQLTFKAFVDFTDTTKEGGEGYYSIGLYDSDTKNIDWIQIRSTSMSLKNANGSSSSIGAFPFQSNYQQIYSYHQYEDYNILPYDVKIVVTDKVEVYAKKSNKSNWQYVGYSNNLTVGNKREIVLSYYDSIVRIDDVKVYELPKNTTNSVIVSDNDVETHLSNTVLKQYPTENDTLISGTIQINKEKYPDNTIKDYTKTIYIYVNKFDDKYQLYNDYYSKTYTTTNIDSNGNWQIVLDEPLIGNELIYAYQNDSRIGDSLYTIIQAKYLDSSTPLGICSISEATDEITGVAKSGIKYNDIIISIPNNGNYHVLLNDDEKNGYVTWNLPISTNKIKLRNEYEITVTGYEKITSNEIVNITPVYDLEETSKKAITSTCIVRPKNQSDIPLVNPICEYDTTLSGTGSPGATILINIPDVELNPYNQEYEYRYVHEFTTTVNSSGKWEKYLVDSNGEVIEMVANIPIRFNQIQTTCKHTLCHDISHNVSADVFVTSREHKYSETPIIYPINDSTALITMMLPLNCELFIEVNGVLKDYYHRTIDRIVDNTMKTGYKLYTQAIVLDDRVEKNTISAYIIEGDYNTKQYVKDKGYVYTTTITKQDQTDTPIINPITEEDRTISGYGIPGGTTYLYLYENENTVNPNYFFMHVDENPVLEGKWGIWSQTIPDSITISDEMKFVFNQDVEDCLKSENVETNASNLYFSNTLTLNTPLTDKSNSISGTGLPDAKIDIYVNDKKVFSGINVNDLGNWKYNIYNILHLHVGDKITIHQVKESVDNEEWVETYVTYEDNQIVGVNNTKDPAEFKQFDTLEECEQWLLSNNNIKWTFNLNREATDNKYKITFNKAKDYEVTDKVYIVYKYIDDNEKLVYVESDKPSTNINTQPFDLQDEIRHLYISQMEANFASKNVTSVLTPIYINKMNLVGPITTSPVNLVGSPYRYETYNKGENYQIKSYSAHGEIYRRTITYNIQLLDKIYDGTPYAPFQVNSIDRFITGDDVSIDNIYDSYSNTNSNPKFFKSIGESYVEYTNSNVEAKKSIKKHNLILRGRDAQNYEIEKVNIVPANILKRDVILNISILRFIRSTGKWEIEYTFDNDIKTDNLTFLFNDLSNSKNMKVYVPVVTKNKGATYDDCNWNNLHEIYSTFFTYSFNKEYVYNSGNLKPLSEDRNSVYWKDSDRVAEPNTNRMDIDITINDKYDGNVQIALNDVYYESSDKQYKLYDGQYVKVTNLNIHPQHDKAQNYNLTTKDIYCKIQII